MRRRWRSLAPWVGRAALLAAGLVLVAGAAYVVFNVEPGQMPSQPGEVQLVTERTDTWTPDRGDQEALRQRSLTTQDTGEGLLLQETLDAPAPPRGQRFQLALDDELEVADEPGARVSFPSTPLFNAPPERVYLAVPWEGQGPDETDPVGAIDTFRRMGTVEQHDVTLVRYHARHSSQFFVQGDTIWFRQSNRTALVEPVTGTIVDYHDEETLWTKPAQSDPLIGNLLNELTTKGKVWEATVQPTPASQAALLEQAIAARGEHLQGLLAKALPALGAGELLLWAAIANRPRRFFDGAG